MNSALLEEHNYVKKGTQEDYEIQWDSNSSTLNYSVTEKKISLCLYF